MIAEHQTTLSYMWWNSGPLKSGHVLHDPVVHIKLYFCDDWHNWQNIVYLLVIKRAVCYNLCYIYIFAIYNLLCLLFWKANMFSLWKPKSYLSTLSIQMHHSSCFKWQIYAKSIKSTDCCFKFVKWPSPKTLSPFVFIEWHSLPTCKNIQFYSVQLV